MLSDECQLVVPCRETQVVKVIKVCQVQRVYLDNLVVMDVTDHEETQDRRYVVSAPDTV